MYRRDFMANKQYKSSNEVLVIDINRVEYKWKVELYGKQRGKKDSKMFFL